MATILTLSGKALAERNIKDKGFGALYSTNLYPAFFLFGKQLNARGSKFLEDRGVQLDGSQGEATKKKGTKRKKKGDVITKEDQLTNWAEFRQAQGLQIEHVDLTYSGKMWAGMAPLEPVITGNKVIAPLGGNNKQAQDEMNYNRDRYGDFIGKALTPDNMRTLNDVVKREFLDVLMQHKP